MSILQEYENIRKEIGEEKYNAIEKYLNSHKDILLSDVYYTREGWEAFEDWYKKEVSNMEKIKIISTEEFKNALHNPQKKILVFGTAGIGGTSIAQEFIEQQIKKDTKDYFKNKYNTIPYIEKYIDLLIKYNMSPHKIDRCLYFIKHDMNELFTKALVGGHIAEEIARLRKETPYEYGKHAMKGGEII